MDEQPDSAAKIAADLRARKESNLEGYDVYNEELEAWAARVEALGERQALLDSDKGGVCVTGVPDMSQGRPVVTRPPTEDDTVPPDSLSKIAADLRDWLPVPNPVTTEVIRGWAARVEALGLKPGERETVRGAIESIRYYAHEEGSQLGRTMANVIAALTPIAERKP